MAKKKSKKKRLKKTILWWLTVISLITATIANIVNIFK